MSDEHDAPCTKLIGVPTIRGSPSLFARAFPNSSSNESPLSSDRFTLKVHEHSTMFQRAKSHGPDTVVSMTMSAMRPAPPLPPPKPPGPAVIHLGITLKGLRKLMDKIRGICEAGGRFKVDFDNLTTTELVYK